MEINIFQKNLTPQEEEIFANYLKQKTGAVKDLLTKFSKDATFLKISIEKFDKHDAFEVEFCLVLPTKTMISREASHKITKAVDLSKDRIVAQIKKHSAMLRQDRSHRGIIKDKEAVTANEFDFVVEK